MRWSKTQDKDLKTLKETALMPLHKIVTPLNKKFRPSSLLVICFALTALQCASPSTARCELPTETAIKQQSVPSASESPRQNLLPMKSFFNDVTQYFGTRYRSGGQSPAGFDCSGFVRFMFGKVFNMQLPRSSREMSAIGNKINRSDLQPGDLVFFQTKNRRINHVGIFIGNDTFVHSSLSKGITENKLQENYFEKRFAGAVRLLDLFPDKLPANQQPSSENIEEPS